MCYASAHFAIFHQIILVLSDMEAGTLKLKNTVGYHFQGNFNDFQSFLKVLEVYGSGYDFDSHPKYSRMRDKESHRLTAIKNLHKVDRILEISIEQLSNQTEGLHSPGGYLKVYSNVLRAQLKFFFEF